MGIHIYTSYRRYNTYFIWLSCICFSEDPVLDPLLIRTVPYGLHLILPYLFQEVNVNLVSHIVKFVVMSAQMRDNFLGQIIYKRCWTLTWWNTCTYSVLLLLMWHCVCFYSEMVFWLINNNPLLLPRRWAYWFANVSRSWLDTIGDNEYAGFPFVFITKDPLPGSKGITRASLECDPMECAVEWFLEQPENCANLTCAAWLPSLQP